MTAPLPGHPVLLRPARASGLQATAGGRNGDPVGQGAENVDRPRLSSIEG